MDLGGFQDPCVPQMLNKGTKIDFCVIKWIFLREHVHLKGLRQQDSLVHVSGLVSWFGLR